MSELANLKEERNRFVKMAFCRADLLFELDKEHKIVFVAGATEALFAKTPEQMVGMVFSDLIVDKLRTLVHALLEGTGNKRIEDAPLTLAGQNNYQFPGVAAGYRAPEFDHHTFLAVKIVAPVPQEGEEPDPDHVMDQEEFSNAAAQELKQLLQNGAEGQVTLLKVKRLKDLFKMIGASDKKSLTSAICGVLKKHSLGGKTAGQVSEDSFGYAHEMSLNTDQVNAEIEEVARDYLPEGEDLETKSMTLDADGAGMNETQVAKALVHTMAQFCHSDQKVSNARLSDALDEMMNGTVESVKYIKHVTNESDFDLHYMPICDMRLGRVHHFEALSRFRDPDKAKSTFQLITLAENLGLIADFDYAVLLKVVKYVQQLSAQGTGIPSIAINMSAVSLQNAQFIQRVQSLIKATPGLDKKIMFELTESADVKDLEQMNRVIQSFRQMGFIFCLDDFGAGAASFDYLNALEVDVVKFDGPVVRRACLNKRGHDMLSNMSRMCSAAGVKTVAEMVEDKKVSNQVYYCGIDYGQGWYFGKPDPDPLSFADNFAGQEFKK